MSCALTTGYTLGCRDSVGGIKAIYVQNWISTGSCNANLSGAVTGFTGYNASGFFEYDLTKATSSMTETLNASMENGTIFYSPEVTFTINKMQVAVRNELRLLARSKVIVIVQDNNSRYWLLGAINGLEATATDITILILVRIWDFPKVSNSRYGESGTITTKGTIGASGT